MRNTKSENKQQG